MMLAKLMYLADHELKSCVAKKCILGTHLLRPVGAWSLMVLHFVHCDSSDLWLLGTHLCTTHFNLDLFNVSYQLVQFACIWNDLCNRIEEISGDAQVITYATCDWSWCELSLYRIYSYILIMQYVLYTINELTNIL